MSLPNFGFRPDTSGQGANSMCPPRWNVTTLVWNSRGVFFGEDVFREHFMIFAAQFILFSLANHVIYLVLRPLKQPKFVCSVLTGVLVGPNGLGQYFPRFKEVIHPSYEMMVMRTVGVIAITYFIFIVAVKTDVTIIFRKFKHSVWIGMLNVALPFGTTLLLTSKIHVDGIRPNQYFYNLFAAGLSVSRFATVAYSIDELNLSSSDLGQLAMSASIPSELFTYMWLLVGIFSRQKSAKESMLAAVAVTSMVFLMVFVLRPLLLSIIARTPEGRPMKDVFVTGILLGAMFVTGISDMLGAVNLGVLVLGLIVPDGPPLGAAIVEKAELFVMEFLMPVFYMVVGYNLNVFLIRSQDWKAMIGIIATANVAKFVGAMVPALWCTPHARHAVVIGLMASFKGPFDLFLFNRWLRREELDKSAYTILVITEVMMTVIVSPLVQKMHEKCMELDVQAYKNLRAIQTTPNDTEFRMVFCIEGEEDVPGIISVLESVNVSPLSPLCAYMIHLQELVGRAAPVLISHNEHQGQQIKSKRYFHMSRAFENYLRSSDFHLVIKTFTVIAPFKNIHTDICRLARTELVPVIIMPFHRNSPNAITADATKQAAAFRNVNMNVQCHAPCTVGILVDKGMRRCMPNNKTEFSCEVAVLFLGGPDDREGLALGARMSRHPGVKLFVLRLALNRKETELEDVMEKKADDAILAKFRQVANQNDGVSYNEVVVDDIARIMSEVQDLGDRFTLIIVGRQRESTRKLFDTSEWSENPELGGIGDMIASRDFRGKKTSLLVLQHYEINREPSNRYASKYEDGYLLGPSGSF